jgi:uncharacterized protein YggE
MTTRPFAVLLLCLGCALPPGLASAQSHAAAGVEPGTVSTGASAHRRIPNTVADISVSIQTPGTDVGGVSRDLATRSQALMGWLRDQGAERLATRQISFEPQTHEEKNGQEKIVGYTGTMTVSFRTTAAKSGAILSGALEHGANTIEQTSYSPTEEEEDRTRQALAEEATRTALAQAEAVAAAANTRVVGVRSISVERSSGRPMPMMSMKAMSGAAPAMETAAGDQDVDVHVDVQLLVLR